MKVRKDKRQEVLEVLRYKKAGIGKLWWDKELSSYTGSSKHALRYLEKYCENLGEEGKGFALIGVNGIGKTMLMNVVAKKAVDKGMNTLIIPYWVLVKEYIRSWKENSLFNRMLRTEVLGINDFGKSFEATDKSKLMAVTAVEFILDTFIQNKQRLLITTNLKLQDFRQEYGDSIASKLNEACDFIIMNEQKEQDFRYNYANVITE